MAPTAPSTRAPNGWQSSRDECLLQIIRMSTISSATTTAAAAASNAATLYALLLEKCGPAAAAAAGWAQERYLLLVDAAALRFDDGLALLDPAQANYVRDVAAASQDVVASLARFLASLWALAGLVVVPAARRAVALFRRQPRGLCEGNPCTDPALNNVAVRSMLEQTTGVPKAFRPYRPFSLRGSSRTRHYALLRI